MKKNLEAKLKDITVFLTDVDGVLTDGGMYYTSEGLVMKRFQVKDGMGAVLLKKKGVAVGMITSDASPLGRLRGERLHFDYVFDSVEDKLAVLLKICETRPCALENVAFIGDDVNDAEILSAVGFSAAPRDAHPSIIEIVDYVCEAKGGEGAFREVADMILSSRPDRFGLT